MLAWQWLDHAVECRGSEVASALLSAGQRGSNLTEVGTSLLQSQAQVVGPEAVATLIGASKRGEGAGDIALFG